ncbi:bacillithiol biosynthesis cysteine-adding enzyme BshC [Brevibacillus migulae]|uniref:bacillithiol biosynthesis cysteine-adding enzyme BshC n=1 Tax=Brevibacillus migulae TaxID=1644114 RepID=UPI00106F01F1|nr:bacillithiol biosynthesis cysteine-adding enzyme BshC [Brevibacillus migulae]
MNILNAQFPSSNRLVDDYVNQRMGMQTFFPYTPYDQASYQARLSYLQRRPLPHREQLAEGLLAYNQAIGNHPDALARIHSLRQENAVVVIAGQQAGVLTGPLYTIHKAIHLIQAAKQLEEEHGVPVVPVFWIAGEDHDWEEINHLFLPAGEGLKKCRLDLAKTGKTSASMMPLDLDACRAFLASFFDGMTETEHTAALRRLAEETAAAADNVADWFARIMVSLFGKHGLVFVESSLPFVRELERPVFEQIIQQNEELGSLLLRADEQIKQNGYEPQLAIEENQAHFFLYEEGQRLLLERKQDRFMTKDGRYRYSREQLLTMLETDPARFSANVVTRPLMQEHLFPTLAFIGGPGEVAYWAYFAEVFSHFGYQLPIVLPRMSITLVEGAITRYLQQLDLPATQVLHGFAGWKEAWLKQIKTDSQAEHLLARFAQTKQELLHQYQPLVQDVIAFDQGLAELAEKNTVRLLEQVDFLQQKIEQSLRNRHEVTLTRMQRVEQALLPEGRWQERVYSYFVFANKYGPELIDQLVAAPFSPGPAHHIVSL